MATKMPPDTTRSTKTPTPPQTAFPAVTAIGSFVRWWKMVSESLQQPPDWNRMFRNQTAEFNPALSRLIALTLDDRRRQPGAAVDLGMGGP
jgi:hypothetical protein